MRRPSGSDRYASNYTVKTVTFPVGVMVGGASVVTKELVVLCARKECQYERQIVQ